MTRHTIVPGGERGRGSVSGPALRANRDRPESVRRRSGRRPAEFFHAIDWGYVRFMAAVAATVFVVVYVALGRAA